MNDSTQKQASNPYQQFLLDRVRQSPQAPITEGFPSDLAQWREYATRTQSRLRACFGFPSVACDLDARVTGQRHGPWYTMDQVVFQSETSMLVTAHLYLPKGVSDPVPCIIHTNGHGGSKSVAKSQFAAQLWTKLGVACLTMDTFGEEERDAEARIGPRGHRKNALAERALILGRYPGGIMVHDTVRCIDYLQTRSEIDSHRIGLAGSSLGGMIAQYTAAVDPRVALSVPSAWVHSYKADLGRVEYCWACSRQPGLLQLVDQGELCALPAEHAAQLILVGALDEVSGASEGEGATVVFNQARQVYRLFDREHALNLRVVPRAGHRPFHIGKETALFIHDHLGTPLASRRDIEEMPVYTMGQWSDEQGKLLRGNIDTDFHYRGTLIPIVGATFTRETELFCLPPLSHLDERLGMASWTDALERRLTAKFEPATSRQAWTDHVASLASSVRRLLHLEEMPPSPQPLVLRTFDWQGRRVSEVQYGEVGWTSYRVEPDQSRLPAVIYLSALANKDAALNEPRVTGWLDDGRPVVILDGTWCWSASGWDLMLDRPDLETDVRHVIETLDWLGVEAQGVCCCSRRRDVALFSALVDSRIEQVIELDGHPLTQRQPDRKAGLLPGIALHATRPHLAAALAPRPFSFAPDLEMDKSQHLMRDVYRLFAAEDACTRLPDHAASA